ncbi:unnamed protein product [Anisakis simplex]|uniref:Uncharacterized protein n=1 Tax=Anisakis simplex TaxID=6269 RepID=A0A3P6NGW8_ANISI|nr:unnamed protein product [Anisakis simplex]
MRMVKHLINQTEQKLKQVKSRKPDLEAAKTAVQCARRDAIKKHVQIFNESIELIRKLESTIKSRTFARRRYQEASRLIWEDNERMSDIKEKLHSAKRRFGECQEEVSEVKQRMEEITRKLFNLCQINSTKENLLDRRQQTLLKDLKNQWTSNSIPSELEHVQEMLADERARLELASSDGTKSVSFSYSLY